VPESGPVPGFRYTASLPGGEKNAGPVCPGPVTDSLSMPVLRGPVLEYGKNIKTGQAVTQFLFKSRYGAFGNENTM